MACKVPFYRHGLNRTYAGGVAPGLETPFFATGAGSQEVEDQLREFFDVPYAILVNSWTNGAIATLLALDIGVGSEVIVPAMTFIATANVIEILGGKPVFTDVDPDPLMMPAGAARGAL